MANHNMAGMLKGMKQRPAEMTYKMYKAMCKAMNCKAMTMNEFKAMPVGGDMDMEKMYMAMKGMYADGTMKGEMPAFLKEKLGKAEGDEEEADEDEQPSFMDEDDDDDDDDREDMEQSSHKAKKSMITASDLLKSIDAYEATDRALREGGTSRESFLTAKYDAGTLTKSERRELGRIWAANEEDTNDYSEDLHKSLYDIVSDDDDTGALVDASDFLKSLVSGVDTRMTSVADEVSRQGRATRELLKAQGSLVKSLAGIVAQQDEIIKALGDRLGVVESTPAPRRSVSARQQNVRGRSLAKSVTAGTADNETLSKAQIQQGLRTLMLHASEQRDESAMDKITHATALFEQTGRLPNNILAAIRAV